MMRVEFFATITASGHLTLVRISFVDALAPVCINRIFIISFHRFFDPRLIFVTRALFLSCMTASLAGVVVLLLRISLQIFSTALAHAPSGSSAFTQIEMLSSNLM